MMTCKLADIGCGGPTGCNECDFDLIAFFDCLHDMADPVGAAKPSSGQ